jgi:hypothetical protein
LTKGSFRLFDELLCESSPADVDVSVDLAGFTGVNGESELGGGIRLLKHK